jgi:hypothetical protein
LRLAPSRGRTSGEAAAAGRVQNAKKTGGAGARADPAATHPPPRRRQPPGARPRQHELRGTRARRARDATVFAACPRRLNPRMRRLPSCLALLLAAACSEADVVAVRVEVLPDGSGIVHASSLRIPQGKGPIEAETSGIEWQSRVDLFCVRGTFRKLEQLRIADITFTSTTGANGVSVLTATLPRGDQARWFRVLAPAREERKVATETFDPTGTVKQPGGTVKLVITLPRPVIGHGVAPKGRGITEEAEKNQAQLVVPVDAALLNADPLVWDVTWR